MINIRFGFGSISFGLFTICTRVGMLNEVKQITEPLFSHRFFPGRRSHLTEVAAGDPSSQLTRAFFAGLIVTEIRSPVTRFRTLSVIQVGDST